DQLKQRGFDSSLVNASRLLTFLRQIRRDESRARIFYPSADLLAKADAIYQNFRTADWPATKIAAPDIRPEELNALEGRPRHVDEDDARLRTMKGTKGVAAVVRLAHDVDALLDAEQHAECFPHQSFAADDRETDRPPQGS